jgi:hypothetical protein
VARICAEAISEGKATSSGDVTLKATNEVVTRKPSLMYPFCIRIGLAARAALRPAERKYVPPAKARSYGRHYCDAALGSGKVFDGNGYTERERDAVLRDHPDLFLPFFLAGALARFDAKPIPGVSRAAQVRLMTRVCVDAAKRGIMKGDASFDRSRLIALVHEDTAKLRAQGEYP